MVMFFDQDDPTSRTRIEAILALPLAPRRYTDNAFIRRVGVIKVEERIPSIDAFALALAERLNIPLVTTDHHEFAAVERVALIDQGEIDENTNGRVD
jgi:predicted nucleic acid-binding protein